MKAAGGQSVASVSGDVTRGRVRWHIRAGCTATSATVTSVPPANHPHPHRPNTIRLSICPACTPGGTHWSFSCSVAPMVAVAGLRLGEQRMRRSEQCACMQRCYSSRLAFGVSQYCKQGTGQLPEDPNTSKNTRGRDFASLLITQHAQARAMTRLGLPQALFERIKPMPCIRSNSTDALTHRAPQEIIK